MAYNKTDLIQFIEDSIKQNQGLSPQMVKDIEAIVKTQVEMGDASVYVKAINEDTEQVKRLLEDVLEGTATGETTINVNTSSDVNLESDPSEKKSFREALAAKVRSGTDSMDFHSDSITGGMSQIGGQISGTINQILGEEKQNVIDPLIGIGLGIISIFNGLITFDKEKIDLAEESNERLDDIYNTGQEQLDFAEETRAALDDTYRLQKEQYDLEKEDSLRSQREGEDKDEGSALGKLIKGLLIAYAAGLALGGMIAYLALPFEVLWTAAEKLAVRFGLMNKTVTKGMTLFERVGILFNKIPILFRLKTLATSFDRLNALGTLLKQGFRAMYNFDEAVAFFKDLPDTFAKLRKTQVAVGDAAVILDDSAKAVSKFPNLTKAVTAWRAWWKGIWDGFKLWTETGKYIGKNVGRLGKILGTVFRWIGEIGIYFTKFGAFMKGFAHGFAKLAWPLTILLGVVDFIKGFIGSSEATFLGKIKDGLEQVIVGFFEMPLRLLGWLYDKALQFIGIESSGSGDAMVSGLKNIMGAIFDPIVAVLNFIVDVVIIPLKVMGVWFYNAAKFIINALSAGLRIIWTPIRLVIAVVIETFRTIVEMVQGVFTSIGAVIATIWAVIGNIFKGVIKLFTGDIAGAMEEFGGIKEILIKGFWKLMDGLLLIFEAPTRWFDRMMEHIKIAVTSFIGAFIDLIKAPFIWMAGMIAGIFPILKGVLEDTWLEPIVTLFQKIGEFIGKIWDWVASYIKKIPFVGDKFKDEAELKAQERKEDVKRLTEIKVEKTNMSPAYKRLETKSMEKGGLGWMDTRKFDNLKKRNEELSKEQQTLESKLYTKKKDTDFKVGDTGMKQVDSTVGVAAGLIAGVKSIDKAQDYGYTSVKRDAGIDTMVASAPSLQFMPETPSLANFDPTPAAKVQAIKRQMEQAASTTAAVNKMNKDQKDKPERPIVVNTPEAQKRIIEPPEDIEAMSILFLNKSWGLG